MPDITDYLNGIRNAVLGKEVREDIAAGIEQCYKDGKAGSIDLAARTGVTGLTTRMTSAEVRVSAAELDIDDLETDVAALTAAVGSPLVASTAAGMTDHSKIYVYTGSEDGYTAGNWYYYDGSAWASGGVYNSTAVQTDTTLTVSGTAADAAAVGGELGRLRDVLSGVGNAEFLEWNDGYYYDLRGDSVDVSSPSPSASYACAVDSYSPGTLYLYWGLGASAARTYAAVSSSGAILEALGSTPSQAVSKCRLIGISSDYLTTTAKMVFNSKASVAHAVLKLTGVSEIAPNTELDSLTDPGTYFSRTGTITGTLGHIPDGANSGFVLFTKKSHPTSANYAAQILMLSKADTSVWLRTYSASAWGDWKRVVTDADLETLLNISDLAAISEGDDMDDYTTPGSYACGTAAICVTLDNQPLVSPAGFSLYVVRSRFNTDGTNYIRQIIFPNKAGSSPVYTRTKTTEWGDWQLLTSVNGATRPKIAGNGALPPAMVSGTPKLKLRVGTHNVAHYWIQGSSFGRRYLSDYPVKIARWRDWLMSANLDILMLQECEDYIDSARTASAFNSLYRYYFGGDTNPDPTTTSATGDNYEPDATDASRRKILNRIGLNTSSTMVTVNTSTPATYSKNGYYNWVVCNIADVGSVLLVDVHSFSGSDSDRVTDRANYLASVANLIQAQNCDYFIIAGDFNVTTDTDKANLMSFCTTVGGTPVNGGLIGWFETFGTEEYAIKTYDNIVVSNNIRVAAIECEPELVPGGRIHSDHTPVVAELWLM